MNAGQFAVVVAAIGSAISIGTIVFLAGALKGVVSARLDNIERRLSEIEHSMKRMGFTIRAAGEES